MASTGLASFKRAWGLHSLKIPRLSLGPETIKHLPRHANSLYLVVLQNVFIIFSIYFVSIYNRKHRRFCGTK